MAKRSLAVRTGLFVSAATEMELRLVYDWVSMPLPAPCRHLAAEVGISTLTHGADMRVGIPLERARRFCGEGFSEPFVVFLPIDNIGLSK